LPYFIKTFSRPFNWPEDDKPYWSLKCPDTKYERAKTKASYLYKSDSMLSDKTLCMIARQGDEDEYMHFDVHNMYGHSEAIVSFEAAQKATNTRGLVITRSSFIGTGQYAGTWTGDNDSVYDC
jgi:alpha-glucosidase (family GH31 glycosyl hydrolase)